MTTDRKAGKTSGQFAYEADLRQCPLFNGKPRPAWADLADSAKEGWEWYATQQSVRRAYAQPKP